MAGDDDANLCQVCGAPLDGHLVTCTRCDTPHHTDCWRWNGGCSTYGCGSTQARGLDRVVAPTCVEAPLSVVEDDAPPPPPVLVIDDAFPGDHLPSDVAPRCDAPPFVPPPPADPGRLGSVALPVVSWMARQAGHLGLNLAVLAVKAAAVVGYLAVLPGSLLWRAVFSMSDLQFARGGRRARPEGLEGMVASALGRTAYGVLNCVAVFTMIMLAAWAVLTDAPGVEWLLYPIGSYLVLAPFLIPLMEDLTELPLPGFPVGTIDPERLAAVEDDRAERRLQRRLPPTEAGAHPSRPGRRSKRKGARKRRRRF